MKKLKNVFLLGFLISLSVFLGTHFSFLMESLCVDVNFYYIDYMTSSVEENSMKVERDYFKSKHFDRSVVNGILSDLKYAVADEENYSNYPSEGDYEETQREYIKYSKKNSKDYLKNIDHIEYYAINNKTKEVFTNTNYKTISEFKKNADGYYQAEFDKENLVDRKIDNVKYESLNDFSYMNEDVDNNDDISAYISISKDMAKGGYLSYDYIQYQNVLKQYDICKKYGLPALVLAVVFLAIYIIMNFKLPKTKREFWHYYNKIPLEVVIAFLATDISMIFVVADTNNGTMVKQLCIIPIFILLFYFILLIKQISNFERKRDFFKTSWIFKIICWIFRKSKKAFREARALIQTSQKFTLIKKIIALAVICVIAELFFVLFGPLGIIIALGIQLGFLIYLVKRLSYLSEIIDGVHKIKEGQVDYKIEEKDDLYFKSLANDVNNIGEGLENSIEGRIKSERMKSELITNVSHDLKTPLTSIINYVELIKKEENISPDYLKDYVNVLDKKSKRLKVLIEDLFEASKASTGNIELELVKLDLKQLIRQSIGELEDKLEDAKLSLRVNLTEEDTFVLADGRRMYRVFENLLSNICKYSLENTRVYIDLEKRDGKITATMKNISSYELNFDPEEIMERFKRADESRNTEGSGLGLAIARDLVNLQGGNLTIDIDGDLFKVTVEMDEYTPISLSKDK
ncbi:MAG: sensor histidine kinase [Intestinibacter sp.]|uniref:sensor histidine kinase n=1 Tax=Intestinibacter sp. TaxID=1965304 RepID=UPI002A82D00A|nr:sensor histidine kinase [Intestinibacter sp.]MDY4574362.1 sensor histidine kinase [Intestinibacter sp.]